MEDFPSTLHLLWTDAATDAAAMTAAVAAGATGSPSGWCRGLYGLHSDRASTSSSASSTGSENKDRAEEGTLQDHDESSTFDHDERVTMVAWLTGECAKAVSGRSSDELLPELLDGLSSTAADTAVRPIACHSTSWSANRFIRGSYSYPRAGAPSDVTQKLSAPLVDESSGDVKVCFAGEATSEQCCLERSVARCSRDGGRRRGS